MSFLRDLIESVVPAAYAEEPEEEEEEVEESTEESSEEATEESEEDDDEDEDEDDEDEDELVDPLVTLSEECASTEACKPFNHHFHECIERVTKESEEEGYAEKHYKEDCVEEFFHLQHCINDCVAPRLFHKLK
ncbi:ubiquinol-cytochrome c oxidoreductase subunit 6 [Scheffersomyces xylosifermentans]|uniref:ubiquinol-cytochrome c oxidoreductase subunit 6 n=1 Tax=Scheffersomyces xylosifermentans TaxID=1304137 RepID=UPI00315CD20C